MRVLVACEESQRVCTAFREKGHEAYSCDIIECSGGHPEWHIQGDALEVLNADKDYGLHFRTADGVLHWVERWDLIIAHPPCTYLTVAANKLYDVEKYGEKAVKRKADREKAIKFFMKFVNADCERIAIENPIGIISTRYRKPDQIIQPYQFGHPVRKSTCLWLKGLQPLIPTNVDSSESGVSDALWQVRQGKFNLPGIRKLKIIISLHSSECLKGEEKKVFPNLKNGTTRKLYSSGGWKKTLCR